MSGFGKNGVGFSSSGSGGGGGSATMATPIILTVVLSGTTITDASLGGVVANKVTSVTRGGFFVNLVTGAPSIGQCAISGNTLTVNAAEPLVPTEIITINQLS